MDPIRIPLSLVLQARFAERDAEIAKQQALRTECLSAVVAGALSPEQFASITTWSIEVTATEIVCTPPALALVADEAVSA